MIRWGCKCLMSPGYTSTAFSRNSPTQQHWMVQTRMDRKSPQLRPFACLSSNQPQPNPSPELHMKRVFGPKSPNLGKNCQAKSAQKFMFHSTTSILPVFSQGPPFQSTSRSRQPLRNPLPPEHHNCERERNFQTWRHVHAIPAHCNRVVLFLSANWPSCNRI